jgi:hypothetical protein
MKPPPFTTDNQEIARAVDASGQECALEQSIIVGWWRYESEYGDPFDKGLFQRNKPEKNGIPLYAQPITRPVQHQQAFGAAPSNKGVDARAARGEGDTPKELSLHWYAFNFRNAATLDANDWWLALEKFVQNIEGERDAALAEVSELQRYIALCLRGQVPEVIFKDFQSKIWELQKQHVRDLAIIESCRRAVQSAIDKLR